MDVRHFWRVRKRIAEISVPAWPIPIQKTKLVMSHAQPTGMVISPDADAGGDQVDDATEEQQGQGVSVTAMHAHHQSGVFDSTMELT